MSLKGTFLRDLDLYTSLLIFARGLRSREIGVGIGNAWVFLVLSLQDHAGFMVFKVSLLIIVLVNSAY